MSDDLISRSYLLEQYDLKDCIKYGNETAEQQRKSYDTMMMYEIAGMIEDAPTAYDVDNVIKTVNEIGKRYCDSVKCDNNCEDCEHGCLMRAITNVAKSGGVQNDKI